MDKNRMDGAFPLVVPTDFDSVDTGMTLRDYFAAKAMAGMIIRNKGYMEFDVQHAYEYADAMLLERQKKLSPEK